MGAGSAELSCLAATAAVRQARRLLGSGDLFDDEGVRAAAVVQFAGGGHAVAGEFQQARILTFGGSGAIDGPVDGAVLGQDHELGALFGTGQRAVAADGFFQVLGESAGGVEDVAFHGYGLLLGKQRTRRNEKHRNEQRGQGLFDKSHCVYLLTFFFQGCLSGKLPSSRGLCADHIR